MSKSRLTLLSEKIEAAKPSLSLTHICDGLGFRSITESGQITPSHCNIYNEQLLYTFYGRPAYKIKDADKLPSQSYYLPVCFLIRPETIKAIKRVTALDTGAFSHEFLIPGIHKKMIKEDFGLEPNIEAAAKLVRFMYGDNDGYLKNTMLPEIKRGALDFEVDALISVGRQSASPTPDERSTTIEVQVSEALKLRDCCEAIVMPNLFLNDEEVTRKTNGIPRLGYSVVQQLAPSMYSMPIYDLVFQFLKQKGCVGV